MTSKLDLFIENAVALAKEKKQAKKKGKVDLDKLTNAGESEFQIARRRLEAFTLKQKTFRWTYSEVTLLIRESTCKCCGKVQEQWPDGVHITLEHPIMGRHQKNISEDYSPDLYPGVPRKVEYMPVSIPTCIECFESEACCGEQLDLFPEEKQTFSLHEPFANEKLKIIQLNHEIKELEKNHA